MDVQANIVAQMVREEGIQCLVRVSSILHVERVWMHTLPERSKPSDLSSSFNPFSAMPWSLSKERLEVSRHRARQLRCTLSTALYRSRWGSENLPLTGHVLVMSEIQLPHSCILVSVLELRLLSLDKELTPPPSTRTKSPSLEFNVSRVPQQFRR